MATDEALVVAIKNIADRIPEILTGLPVKYGDIQEENRENVLFASIHSACNGPVGVKKVTTFPLIPGTHRITEWVKVSNSGWREFVRLVALEINKIMPELDCNSRRRFKNLWPLYEERGN